MSTLIAAGAIFAVIAGAIFLAWSRGVKAGSDSSAAKTAEKTADVLRRQGDAVANAPTGKAAVVDRLRKGGGL